MSYRNKTYVAFASEDIKSYYLMKAWRDNENIDFNFIDAHDLNTALDTSQPDTIRRRLRERLANTKQVVVLVGDVTSPKAALSGSFLYYEIEVIESLSLPVVFANLNQYRKAEEIRMPSKLRSPYYTMSVSFQPKIIKYALDDYAEGYEDSTNEGAYWYKETVYKELGL